MIGEDRPAPQVRTIAEPIQPVATRYLDIEANKAAGMRALSRHTAAARTITIQPYDDIAANKAHSQGRR